jgi:hypothetical protein
MSFCQKAGSTPCRPGPTLESCAPSSSERRYAAHTASDTYPAGERESVCARFVLRRRGVRVRCRAGDATQEEARERDMQGRGP